MSDRLEETLNRMRAITAELGKTRERLGALEAELLRLDGRRQLLEELAAEEDETSE